MKPTRAVTDLLESWDIKAIESPQWKKRKFVQDWERYIPDKMIEIWENLSLEEKASAYLVAKEAADSEVWE